MAEPPDNHTDRAERNLEEATRTVERFSDEVATAVTSAFRQIAMEGRNFETTLRTIALSLADRQLSRAIGAAGDSLGGAFAAWLKPAFGIAGTYGPGIADGMAASPVRAFADGGVIATPTYFPLQAGIGLAGEAGPEAILPLQRANDGSLGVRTSGPTGRPVQITFNVAATDADSFRRSEANLTAMLARAVARGQRGL